MQVFRISDAPREGETPIKPVWGLGKVRGNCSAQASAMAAVLRTDVYPAVVLEHDAERLREGWPDFAQCANAGMDWLWLGGSTIWCDERGEEVRDRPMPWMPSPVAGVAKVDGLYTTHAVAILTPDGAMRALCAALQGIRKGWPVDVAIIMECRHMGWERWCVTEPWFCQRGVNRRWTDKPLPPPLP